MKKTENDEKVMASYETNKKIRKDWNGVNPITKVYRDRKKDQRVKHKGKEFDYE